MNILSKSGYVPWYERPLKALISNSVSSDGTVDQLIAEVQNGSGVVTQIAVSSYHDLNVIVDGQSIGKALIPDGANEKKNIHFKDSVKIEGLGKGSGLAGSSSAVVRVYQ